MPNIHFFNMIAFMPCILNFMFQHSKCYFEKVIFLLAFRNQ